MIIKVRTMDDGWEFHKVEKTIKARDLTKEQYEFGVSDNTPHYTHIDLENLYSSDGAIFVKVINIDNGKIIIYTNRLSYLLNDEGKTIERIN